MKREKFFLSLIFILLVGISALVYSLAESNGDFVKNSFTQSVGIKKNTEIFMCADDGNAMQTCVTIASVLKNALENEKINIHIVSFSDNPMSENHIDKIKSLGKTIKPFDLDFFYFDKNRLREFHVDHWNPAIMVKLFAPSIFQNFDRIIWLDDDLIVRESLNHFMNDNLDGKYMAGVEISEMYRTLDNKVCSHWITAGLGVYNLKEMRKNNVQEFLLESAKKYPKDGNNKKEYCGGAEEFALSQIPVEKVKVLPYKYSVMCFLYIRDNHPSMSIKDCAVLHYSWLKPWKIWDRKALEKNVCLELWDKYFAMTEYAKENRE